MSPFARVLAELVDAFSSSTDAHAKKTEFARLVGIHKSTLSHLLAGTSRPSTDACLRIAVGTETSPTDLLRAAGKVRIAQLLDEYYKPSDLTPRPRAPRLTRAEQRVVRQWRALSQRGKLVIRIVLEGVRQQERLDPGRSDPPD